LLVPGGVMAICVATPAVPVAVNVTEPEFVALAVSVFGPAAVPSFQLVTDAIPFEFVVAVPPTTDPPPDATVKVTDAPRIGFPFTSLISTVGATETLVLTVADCPSPALLEIRPAPTAPVAVKITGLPLSPALDAESTSTPAVPLSVQLPTVATPPALLVVTAPVTAPPPDVIANVTVTPLTGLPNASVMSTLGGGNTSVPAVAASEVAVFAAIDAAAPAFPVAVKVTVLLDEDPLVTVSVLLPDTLPSVQLPTVAMPLVFVVARAPVTDPPPDATANVTDTPLSGFPNGSVTITLGGGDTGSPAVPVRFVAEFAASVLAPDVVVVAVAVNVSGLPARFALVAVSVFAPTVVPSVQLPTVATPLPFVVVEAPVTLPPPDATANVTGTPRTGLLNRSFTITLGGDATAVLTIADWPLPELMASCVAAPAGTVTASVLTWSPAVAVSVCVPAVVLRTQTTLAMPSGPVVTVHGFVAVTVVHTALADA
jgi:hypothetical protein